MAIKEINPGRGNWETVIFMMVSELVNIEHPTFCRSDLFKTQNLDTALKLSESIGHKKDPKALENTLQGTLNRMRKKGFFESIERGEYVITKSGLEEMAKLAGNERGAGELPFHLIRDAFRSVKKDYSK